MEMGRKKESEFVWCLHCEEGYPRTKVQKGELCKNFERCDGAGFGVDLEGWKEGFGESHPEWPEVPVPGVRYLLYS